RVGKIPTPSRHTKESSKILEPSANKQTRQAPPHCCPTEGWTPRERPLQLPCPKTWAQQERLKHCLKTKTVKRKLYRKLHQLLEESNERIQQAKCIQNIKKGLQIGTILNPNKKLYTKNSINKVQAQRP